MQTNMAYYNILLKDVIALDHKQAVNYLDRRGSIHYLIGIHKVFDGKTRTKINKTPKLHHRHICSKLFSSCLLDSSNKKVAKFICLILFFKTCMKRSIPLFYVRPNIFPSNLCPKQNGQDGRKTTTRSTNLSIML